MARPRKTKTTRSPRSVRSTAVTPSVAAVSAMGERTVTLPIVNTVSVRTLAIAGAILVVGLLLLWAGRSLIVAGMVNNKPIWRWELEDRMLSRYGDQTMEEIINERLIRDELARRQIKISPVEIDAKQAELEQSLQGQITLQDALAQQGMTLEDLRNELELQLAVEKMTADVAGPTDEEVSAYLTQNSEFMMATDEGTMRQSAVDALTREKRNEAFTVIFDEIKAKGNVVKLVN